MTREPVKCPPDKWLAGRVGKQERPSAILAQRPQANEPGIRTAIHRAFIADDEQFIRFGGQTQGGKSRRHDPGVCRKEVEANIGRLPGKPVAAADAEITSGIKEDGKSAHDLDLSRMRLGRSGTTDHDAIGAAAGRNEEGSTGGG